MKIVFLDSYTLNPGDLDDTPLTSIGNLISYDRTKGDEIVDRIGDAKYVLVNKTPITSNTMDACPNLEYIGVAATGYNIIDIEAAEERGIAVCNAPAYSTEAVAQHTFSLIFELTNKVGQYDKTVRDGEWHRCKDFAYTLAPIPMLASKSLGIIGYGNIGKAVGKVAEALGMKVNVYSRDKDACISSDIITIHCPQTKENEGMIDSDFISRMKDGALLINTARGGLLNEEDVAEALRKGKLGGFAADVLPLEPPADPNPLIGIPNSIITPHIAWMATEARERLIKICADNLKSYIEGGNLNRVV